MFDYSKLKGKIVEVFHSQLRFCEAVGITQQSLNKLLTGKSQFSQTRIFQFCDYLDIPKEEIPEYFFCERN